MFELVIIVIAARLVLPLLMLRFPLIGITLTCIADWLDYNVIGSFEQYQLIDKTLDYYYLLICAWTVRSWRDPLAKKIAWGLFVYRTIGVIVFAITNIEWTLLVFPDLFGFFWIFYLLFIRLTKMDILFTKKVTVLLVFIAITIPKILQEYALHIAYPYPHITPDWVYTLLDLPLIIRFMLMISIPMSILFVLARTAKQPDATAVQPVVK